MYHYRLTTKDGTQHDWSRQNQMLRVDPPALAKRWGVGLDAVESIWAVADNGVEYERLWACPETYARLERERAHCKRLDRHGVALEMRNYEQQRIVRTVRDTIEMVRYHLDHLERTADQLDDEILPAVLNSQRDDDLEAVRCALRAYTSIITGLQDELESITREAGRAPERLTSELPDLVTYFNEWIGSTAVYNEPLPTD